MIDITRDPNETDEQFRERIRLWKIEAVPLAQELSQRWVDLIDADTQPPGVVLMALSSLLAAVAISTSQPDNAIEYVSGQANTIATEMVISSLLSGESES